MKRLLLLLPVLCLSSASYSQTPPPPARGLFVGLDLYGGVSNLPGLRRFGDQLWAGNQTFTPSVATLRWESGQQTSARLSVGVADATKGDSPAYRQPVELWVKRTLGQGSVTAGRFFTPFGQQEWQFEAKEGAQWEGPLGALRATVALQKDPTTKKSNGYLRAVHSADSNTQVALSLASGQGITYGTALETGVGADATLTRGSWLLRSELDHFTGPQKQHFSFAMGSATYQGLKGGLKPFTSYYHWDDHTTAGAFGSFHTLIGGVTFPAGPGLTVETAGAQQGNRFNSWLQLRFTWEH